LDQNSYKPDSVHDAQQLTNRKYLVHKVKITHKEVSLGQRHHHLHHHLSCYLGIVCDMPLDEKPTQRD